ncbi:hypothetical protein QOT17_013383 [Balamuthia mandrillaris]
MRPSKTRSSSSSSSSASSSSSTRCSARQSDKPMAFSLPASGSELEASGELVRNPLVPVTGPEEWQIRLGMVVNDRYCPCVYVPPAAVHAYHLPAQPGWYLEVPGEDVNFKLCLKVQKPRHPQKVAVWTEVDGQIADKSILGKSTGYEVEGFYIGRKSTRAGYIQQFQLSKASFMPTREQRQSNEKVNESHISSRRMIGTIHVKVFGVEKNQKPVRRTYKKKFPRQELLLEEKSSFGVERSVDAGPVVKDSVQLSKYRSNGQLIAELQVFYRTGRFMETLARCVKPLARVQTKEDRHAKEEQDQKKFIKAEPGLATTPLADDRESIDAFLSCFAEYEEIELDLVEPMAKELRKRHCTTVGELRALQKDQWRQVMRSSRLPVSVAHSAMKLLALPPTDLIVID